MCTGTGSALNAITNPVASIYSPGDPIASKVMGNVLPDSAKHVITSPFRAVARNVPGYTTAETTSNTSKAFSLSSTPAANKTMSEVLGS